jgi:hypothetical protein
MLRQLAVSFAVFQSSNKTTKRAARKWRQQTPGAVPQDVNEV